MLISHRVLLVRVRNELKTSSDELEVGIVDVSEIINRLKKSNSIDRRRVASSTASKTKLWKTIKTSKKSVEKTDKMNRHKKLLVVPCLLEFEMA